MPFTGDLENLHIFDIIQLIHTTRKSGTFSVKGSKGESRIIFSNGYIVAANHLNNRVRIGTVLLKMSVISRENLEETLQVQKNAGMDRRPLLATLIELGKLDHENALKGLKKLIEITIVELIDWTEGAFTFDTEAIAVSPQCSYLPGKMEQGISLDAQMVLMDALRIFDERERDRASGKDVPSYEEFYSDVIPSEGTVKSEEKNSALTAEDLGLADIDDLEEKMPRTFTVRDTFDPLEIHRQQIGEILADFSAEEQESFVSFLKENTSVHQGQARKDGRAGAMILLTRDMLIKHSLMTICKNEGVLVFATDGEEELDNIISQCLVSEIAPILVYDNPEQSEGGLSEEKIVRLRQQVKEKYPEVSQIQLAFPLEYAFTLQSFSDGVRAVIPKPLQESRKETFIVDTINFLETFKSYLTGFLIEQKGLQAGDRQLKKLRDRIVVLRDIVEPPDVPFALLQFVSQVFERSITLVIRSTELICERTIGVNDVTNAGSASAAVLKIPLTEPSVFRDVLEGNRSFYGESDDEFLKEHLFEKIGKPLRPTIMILPLKSHRKIVALIYGDFGTKEVSPVHIDEFEILADQAGMALENALYRKQLNKSS
jgi:hypothetical protein